MSSVIESSESTKPSCSSSNSKFFFKWLLWNSTGIPKPSKAMKNVPKSQSAPVCVQPRMSTATSSEKKHHLTATTSTDQMWPPDDKQERNSDYVYFHPSKVLKTSSTLPEIKDQSHDALPPSLLTSQSSYVLSANTKKYSKFHLCYNSSAKLSQILLPSRVPSRVANDMPVVPVHNSYQSEQNLSSSTVCNKRKVLLCKLCLTLVPVIKMYGLKACGCLFCQQCIQQYLNVNINDGNCVMTCPDAQCPVQGRIEGTEVENFVPKDVFEMFKRLKSNREVELDPTRTWCPMPGCETICYVRTSSDPNTGTPVYCPNCTYTFCSLCKEKWHTQKTCEEWLKELNDDDFPLTDCDDAPIKRCPNCHILIERDEGCAQMMCKRCKHVFCWFCLTSLDDDFLLRHYDKGPCKNKLGHSRASIAWHRTQVVGIFAGFGVLLLVASPLLLIAAPCLLCCRCKPCTKFFDEEPTAV